jgi:thiol-disulfide isomerase/thioredoxin
VNKNTLAIAIALSGIVLGILHYKLKPVVDDKQVQQLAQNFAHSTAWRGQVAPDFGIRTISGENFQLADNVGKKVIVLNFFATWCGPCRAEMPELNRYFNGNKDHSFLLLGIDSHEDQSTVGDFLSDLKIDFPTAIDAGPIEKQYGVTSFPTTVLIGVDGKVQFYESGALANAEVAFDNLLDENRQLMQSGKVISTEAYKLEARKQPSLPLTPADPVVSNDEESKLTPRANDIAARMDCTCGCDKKVHACNCNASTKIKKALATENIEGKSDADVIKSLNKRYCMESM